MGHGDRAACSVDTRPSYDGVVPSRRRPPPCRRWLRRGGRRRRTWAGA